MPEPVADRAARELDVLHSRAPGVRSHILTAPFYVPLRWFAAFRTEDRELVQAPDGLTIRYRATLRDAVETVRGKRDEVENLYYVWVTDDFERLVGVVSLKDLVLESPDRKISEIMNPEVISVSADRDQEEVAHLVKKYDLVTIPVVDVNNRLVGRITHDDIIDVIKEGKTSAI